MLYELWLWILLRSIFDYIELFYNRERIHETLDYVSPVRYEERCAVP